jgi:hypothetical protein
MHVLRRLVEPAAAWRPSTGISRNSNQHNLNSCGSSRLNALFARFRASLHLELTQWLSMGSLALRMRWQAPENRQQRQNNIPPASAMSSCSWLISPQVVQLTRISQVIATISTNKPEFAVTINPTNGISSCARHVALRCHTLRAIVAGLVHFITATDHVHWLHPIDNFQSLSAGRRTVACVY